jgi:ribosome biogenesis ATPase|tara:strand:+ start:312 stop:434 length:123 start_codon:yes stop_codon:yes gene_type:complete
VTGTNIVKTIFKLRDFNEELHEEYVKNGLTPVKKREGKAQ